MTNKLSKHYLAPPPRRASDKASALGDAIIRKRQEEQTKSRRTARSRRLLKGIVHVDTEGKLPWE